MTTATEPQSLYRADWERATQANDHLPEWMHPLRREGMARFEALGFPTRRDEEWRATDIRPIVNTSFAWIDGAEEDAWMREHFKTFSKEVSRHLLPLEKSLLTIVYVNARHSRWTADFGTLAGLPQGVLVTSFENAWTRNPDLMKRYLAQHAHFDKSAFTALNTAFLADGVVVHLPRNTVVEAPILIVHLANPHDGPSVSHPRLLIVAEENSQATIIEAYAGVPDTIYFTNAVTEIVVGENAVVDHYKLNRESQQAYHVATTQIELARSANFTSHSITLGGQLVRNDFNAGLNGEGIVCTLNGLYLARDRQLVDNHTAIDHAKPNCESHELYKGILDGQARGVFNGKIYVHQDAQKTDAKQTNQTLLLSKEAQINTKPQLEIFADDVKCTHGATVGQLSEEGIFYLRSRGIGAAEARNLLTYAFASDIVERIKVESVREELDRALLYRLPQSKA